MGMFCFVVYLYADQCCFGGIHFAQDTTLKFYCQLHFAKDLSEDIIKRIHAELMTHYNVWAFLEKIKYAKKKNCVEWW